MRERVSFLACLILLGGGVRRAKADNAPRFIEDDGHIAVFEHDGSSYDRNTPDGELNTEPRQRLARELVANHGDFYDFIVVFTNFDFDRKGAIGFYTSVRNNVTGIGLPVVDNGAAFGSSGRLQGFIDMGPVSQYRQPPLSLEPTDPDFRTTLGVLSHEIGHQWLAGARFERGGELRSDLLGRDGVHWSFLLESDASFLYGNAWENVSGNRYRSVGVQSRFSELDLYLMGLLSTDEVSPLTLLVNPDVDRSRVPELGAEVDAADLETVTIEHIIAAEGPRAPSEELSQKDFAVAFVFLTDQNLLPTERDIEAVELVRSSFMETFFSLTRGRALVDPDLHHLAPIVPGALPDISLALQWLQTQQQADGRYEAHPLTAARDTGTVVTAFTTLGVGGPRVDDARRWLALQNPTAVDPLARAMLAGADFPAEQLSSLANVDGGYGVAPGYRSDALDTALALQVLADAKLADLLASMQLPDGSWTSIEGQAGDVMTTAEAVLALELVGAHPGAVQAALGWLVDRQQADGGFADGPSAPYATARVLESFLNGAAPSTTVDRAIAFLQQTQSPDGSWSQNVFETASVLRGLVPATSANLSIGPSDVQIAPDPPEVGETVAIEVTVRNRTLVAAGSFDVQLFDGDAELGGIAIGDPQILAGLGAGASRALTFSWDTAGFEGSHTLFAVADLAGAVSEVTKEDNVATRDVEVLPPLPNLLVSLLMVDPQSPVEGTVATLAARVENRGSVLSAATRVRFYREIPRLGIVLGEGLVPTLASGAVEDVSIDWNTSGQLGGHVLYAVVDPGNADVRERVETDNESSLGIDVRAPPPAQPDLELRDFVLTPGELEGLPQNVTASARLANTGLDPVPSARVDLFQGDPDLGGLLLVSQILGVGGDTSVAIELDFTATSGGTRTYFLRADPGGVEERDATNNVASAVLRDRMDVIDVSLVAGSVVTSAASLEPGDTLSVDVTVRNSGTRPLSSVPVGLFYELAPGSAFRLASVVNVSLEPGASAVATLTWKANRSGTVPLQLRVDPDDVLSETDESDNVLGASVDVTASTLPNLSVASSDIAAIPPFLMEGNAAVLEAIVRNLGDGAAEGFEVRFYAGDPANSGYLIGAVPVSGLEPHAEAVASVTWDPVRARGDTLVFVETDAAGAVDELDELDNLVFRVLDIEGLPDLLATTAQLRLSPAFARSGESVTIEASFVNAGEQDAAPMAVEIRLDDPLGGALVASAEIDTLASGETGNLVVAWDTTGVEGEHALHLVLDIRNDVREQREDNNIVRVPVALQDADVFVTPVFFSPNGDGTQDEAALFYRVSAQGELRAEVRDLEERAVRALMAGVDGNGKVVWDGLDDRHLLAPDGEYSMVLLADDAEVLRRRVVLDTNRSRVVEALGTELVGFTQLTCPLPSTVAGPAWLPHDGAAYFIVTSPDAEAPEFPIGLYRISSDATSTELVVSDDGFQGVSFMDRAVDFGSQRVRSISADGERALVTNVAEGLQVVDLATGQRSPLGQDSRARALWTSDGRRILVASSTGLHFHDRNGTLLETLVTGNVEVAILSPDDLRIVYRRRDELVLHVIDADGDGDRVLESTDVADSFGPDVVPEGVDIIDIYLLESIDGVVVRWFFQSAEEEAGPFLVDIDTDEVEPFGSAGELSSDERWEVTTSGGQHVARRFGGREVRPILPTTAGNNLHWSYRDTHLTYRASRSDGCVGQGVWALRSLLNGEAALRLTRLPSGFGVQVSGTASDLNLDNYTLEFASVETPEAFTPIQPPSSSPVVADTMTIWIPPAPGDYLVRLVVRDKAGNETVHLDRIFWQATPPISSLRRGPAYLSPNGDLHQDELLVEYDVLTPANLMFHIRDGDGRSVRAIPRDESAIGPASFVWDGTDDLGVAIEDGRYVLEIEGAELPIFVDTTAPCIEARYSDLYTNDAGKARLSVDLEGRVLDESLDVWELATSEGQILESASRQVGSAGGEGVIRERAPPVQGTEIRARDRAGNETVLPLVGPSRELRALTVEGELVGPFAPGPAAPIDAQFLHPESSFTASAEASFEGDLRFRYRADGESIFTDISTARSIAVHADELTLGTRYVGRFEADAVVSQEIAFTVGPEAIFLSSPTFSLDPVFVDLVLTNTIREPLVEAQLLRTSAGFTEIVKSYRPVPAVDVVKEARPLCGLEATFVVVATGLSGAVYRSTTHLAYPEPTPFVLRGTDCLSVDDASIGSQARPEDAVPSEAGASVRADKGAPESLVLLLDDVEMGRAPFDSNEVGIPFDVSTTQEGSHTLRTQAVLETGETVEGDYGLAFFLDQSIPETAIAFPLEGADACVVTDGGRDFLELEVLVRDRQVDGLSVELRKGDGSWEPRFVEHGFTFPVSTEVQGSARVLLPKGLTGEVTLRLIGKSARIVNEIAGRPAPMAPAPWPRDFNNGSLLATAVRNVFITRSPGMGPLTTDPSAPALFSPNADSLADEIRVRGDAQEAVALTARVFAGDTTSVHVRTIVSDLPQGIGPFEIVWDGRDDSGLFVADGEYRIEIEAVNGCGASSTASVHVETDTTAPTVAIENLVDGQPVSIGVEVIGTATDAHFDQYVLEVGEGETPVTRRVESDVLGNWSVGGLAAGSHTLRLSASDTVFNRASTSVTVDVQSANFIALHRAEPPFFSPNGDARLDETELVFELSAEARVTLQILDGGETVVATLMDGLMLPLGPQSRVWDGLSVSDGEYTVLLRAEHPTTPSLFEESRIAVAVDTFGPSIDIISPQADGFLSLPGVVSGDIADERLDRYLIEVGPATGALTQVASDSLPVTGVIATLRSLADGSYRLRATASDQAGNDAETTYAFAIDSTRPALTLSLPAHGSFVGRLPPSVLVIGDIDEGNLQEYTVEFGFGAPPNVFMPLAGGATAPPETTLATWDLEALPDGPYTLRLAASDQAANSASVESDVVLDKTPPTAVIELPSAVSDTVAVRGSLSDANFSEGTLLVAPAEHPEQLTELASFSSPVSAGVLVEGLALADGDYVLQLRVEDRAGNVATTSHAVSVDTEPPRPPSDVVVASQKQDITVSWTASPSIDVSGYHISRDSVRITVEPILTLSFVDASLDEGRYVYTVVAIDDADLESEPTTPAVATIDLTPPHAALHSPDEGERVRVQVDVIGTAFAEEDFFEYRLTAAPAQNFLNPTLVRRSSVPVAFDTLAQWQPVVDGDYVLSLEAEDTSGNVAADRIVVTVDNQAPSAPVLIRAEALTKPDDIEIEWQAPVDSDVQGFLVFRNGRIANAPGNVSGSLEPFLLAGPTYFDSDLPDGEHCYRVAAMDAAGNLSSDSNALCVFLDNRAPAAVIVDPESGTRFDAPRSLRATSEDLDVATVAFEFQRVGDASWTVIGTDSDTPFEVVWDIAGLPFGDYELRAVATDIGTRPDPAPVSIDVVLGDATPPAAPTGLTARVTGDRIALAWDASADVDLGGYRIFRDDTVVLETGPADSSAVDAGVGDGLHTYSLRAFDLDGNESDAIAVPVRVYAPSLTPPFPVFDTAVIDLSGRGAEPGAAVKLLPAATPEVLADAQGAFTFPALDFPLGAHVLDVDATDAKGNVSRRSNEILLVRNDRPEPPAGFGVSAAFDEATLSWDPSPAADVSGYLATRDGELLNTRGLLRPSGAIPTDVSVTASTSASAAPNVIDGSTRSWGIGSDEEQWIELQLSEVRHVDEIRLRWLANRAASDYDLLLELEGRLAPVARVRNGPAQSLSAHALPLPVRTTRVRLHIFSGAVSFGILLDELELVGIAPETGTSFIDAPAEPGLYDYAVSVLDLFGSRSDEAGPVNAGVGDLTPPERPTALTATVLAEDVSLSWTASVSTDVERYRVFRDGAFIAETFSTFYTDRDLLNGSYLYEVSAVDDVGNESTRSDPASASVDVAPPDPPALSLNVVPAGGALSLAWTASTGTAYSVLRAAGSGGPYTEIARVHAGTLAYVDTDLENGVELFYVVRAVDARGQESQDSNEVSGVPNDTEAPPPPLFVAPATPGAALTLTSSRVKLLGAAEPSSVVDVSRDGAPVGSILAADTFTDVADPFLGSSSNVSGRFALSPDRDVVAEVGSSFDTEIRLYDLRTGDVRSVPYVGSGSFERGAAFSPSGRFLAVATTIGTDVNRSLRIVDLEAGTTELIGLTAAPGAPAWISENELGAVVGNDIRVFELASDTERTVYSSTSGFEPTHLTVSPDRTMLAWRERGSELHILPSSGGAPELVVNDFRLDAFVWSGSRTLAYTLFDVGLHFYDIDAVATVHVAGSEDVHTPVSLGVGGAVSASRAQRLLWVFTEGANGRLVDLGEPPRPFDGSFLAWSSELRLAGTSVAEFRLPILETPGRFELDAKLLPGLNVLVAKTTDGEGNESVDSESIELAFDNSSLADLAVVGALGIIPAAPITGQNASVSIPIRNQGLNRSEPTVVSVTGSDPVGTLYAVGTASVPALDPGARTTTSLGWSTTGRLGTQTIVATLDPLELLDESDESNNLASAQATVVGTAALELVLAASGTGQTVELTVQAVNGGASRDAVLETVIEDPNGGAVALVDSRSLRLDYAESLRYGVFWSTEAVAAGSYVARVRDVDGAAATEAPVEIARTIDVELDVISGRPVYEQGDAVSFLARLANSESNTPLRNASVRYRVVDPLGQTVFDATQSLGYVAMGGVSSPETIWQSGAVEPGTYTLTVEASESLELIATTGTSFEMQAASTVKLTGSVALTDAAVPSGSELGVSYTIDNGSVVALDDGIVRAELLDVSGVVASVEGPLSIAASAGVTGELRIDTAGLALGSYTVALSVLEPLATTPVTLYATPSAPSLNAPARGTSARQRVVLSVNNASNPNNETLTYEFELYLDVSLSIAVGAASGLPEGPNTTAWPVLSFLDENRRYYWRARAMDRFATSDWMPPAEVFVDSENEAPDAPALSEPADSTDVGVSRPTLVVGEAVDPEGDVLSYAFELYRDAGLIDLVASIEGSVATSFTPPADLGEDETYHWRARANDGELDSDWMPAVSFRVNTANHAPGAPVPLAPADTSVPALHPELVATAATDPEGDPVTYVFQVDVSEQFDSPALQESMASVDPRWTPPEVLVENGVYFWRAHASDGVAAGPWSVTAGFRVDVQNEPPSRPTPQRPGDGTIVESATPVLAVVNASDPEEDSLVYEFEVYEDEQLTIPAAGITALPEGDTETAWAVSPRLDEDKTYYWIASGNDGELDGAASLPQSFRVNVMNEKPSAPALVTPAEGSIISDPAPLLVVGNAADADGDALSYVFEVYEDELLETLVERSGALPETVAQTSWQIGTALQENHLYYWRARAFDGRLHGAWMATARFRFSLQNEAPSSPALVSPADGNTVAETRPTLVAAAAMDPEDDTLRYVFEIYQDAALDELVVRSPELDEPSWQVSVVLGENDTFYWHALATDGALESRPGAAFRFQVNAIEEPPTIPVLVAPVDGATIEVTEPTLAVEDAMSPDGETLVYHFALFADEALIELISEQRATDQTSWSPPVSLDPGETYFWRARAIDARGLASDWAESFEFTVEPSAGDCPPVWKDDFESYPNGKPPDGWQLEMELKNPVFHVKKVQSSRKLESSVSGRGSLLYAREGEAFGWRNYEFTGELLRKETGPPKKKSSCAFGSGVVFYASPTDSTAYRLELTSLRCQDPKARIVKIAGSQEYVLATRDLDRDYDDESMRFYVETITGAETTSIRARLQGFVKNEEREWALDVEDTDKPLRAGTVGAWGSFEKVAWDDFHVQEVDGLKSGITGECEGDDP